MKRKLNKSFTAFPTKQIHTYYYAPTLFFSYVLSLLCFRKHFEGTAALTEDKSQRSFEITL